MCASVFAGVETCGAGRGMTICIYVGQRPVGFVHTVLLKGVVEKYREGGRLGHNYGGRRTKKTVWHVMVGGEREMAHWHSGPAIRAPLTRI